MFNSNKEDLNETQIKIMEAAMAEFLEKGFSGARMQNIADNAGMNKALLHYYYRNKESLFKQVFLDVLIDMFSMLTDIIETEIDFESKLNKLVKSYMNYLIEHRQFPLFLLNEIYRNPEIVDQVLRESDVTETWDKFYNELCQSQKNGDVIELNPAHIIVTIVSLVVFPVAASNVITRFADISQSEYYEFLQERIDIIPEFLIKALLKK